MKTATRMALLAPAALLIAAAVAGAQVPTTMNYQFTLTDDADAVIVDTPVEVVFRLYTDPLAGTLEWTETHSTSTNHMGVVSAVLGETSPLDPADFHQPLWLEIEVESEILTPRREITSAAFALRAHDSDYLGGVAAADYALSAGTGDGHSLDASDGSPTDQVYVNAAGNVGIGTTSPNEDVHVHDGTGLVYQRFTNSTTGTGTGDGFKIGINGAGNGYVYQYENAAISFSTNGMYRGKFDGDGTFELGNDLVDGGFEFYGAGSTDPIIKFTDDGDTGGEIILYNAAGGMNVAIETDSTDDDSGYMQIYGGGAGFFRVDGALSATTGPRVTIDGTSSSTIFHGDETGDGAVVLPIDAVASDEMFDEPGVGSYGNDSAVALTGDVQNLVQRTITAPAAGYAFVIGTCEAYCGSAASTDAAYFGVSDNASSIPTDNDTYVRVPSDAPGLFYFAITVHDVFEIGAGSNTFYLLADLVLGEWTVVERTISVIYFPTAYGNITAASHGAPENGEVDPAGAAGPAVVGEMPFERSESIAVNQARVDAELAAMREEIAKLRAEIDPDSGSGN